MLKKATFENEIETWKFKVTSSIEKRENDLKSYPRKSRKSKKSGSTGSSSASLAIIIIIVIIMSLYFIKR